ncbi:hypothetical protein [Mucilaginibacter antarcticus]|uniref:hypothetical protein n=1 Tax=Mucilaginibacter antarcticus TaxID=1855725 RepID=UPI00362EAAF5
MNNVSTFNQYQQPYHVYAVGKWNTQFSVYTLIDADDKYFTVKANSNNAIKKGDVYVPSN